MNPHFTSSSSGRNKTRLVWGVLGSAFAALAIAAAAGFANVPDEKPSEAVMALRETGRAFAEVTQKASPAVVFVSVEKTRPRMLDNDPFDGLRGHPQEDLLKRFFGDQLPRFETPRSTPSVGQGSGFIISPDGYVLTNAHVVDGASRLNVKLKDGREFEAKVVGVDSHTDVAVIKIDGSNLPVLRMGNSDDIEVGQWVLAVGSPFGLPGTVTSGIISAKERSGMGITDYESFIQTDAAINPGNSGGPLVNLSGEAIGINTAIFSRSGGYMGIGFAIPINMAKDVCDQLIKDGSVTRGYLGVMIQELTPELARSFGLDEKESGVLVADVMKDSPADKAGLKTGDVIRDFDGHEVKDVVSFRHRVAGCSPEQQIPVSVTRDGEEVELNVMLGRLDAARTVTGSSTDSRIEPLGLSLRSLNDEYRERYGYEDESGVIVADVEAGSKAARAGFRPGMLIKSVNRQSVESVEDVRRLLDDESSGTSVLFLIKDGANTRYIAVNLAD